MDTDCTGKLFEFQPLETEEKPKKVVAEFTGGDITSDGGSLFLREVENRFGIIKSFASCFTDHRNPELIEHSVEELVGQRIYGLALGYEDLNDHDDLRRDPLLAVTVGKRDPKGEKRVRERDKGKSLAGKSTLNRLELTPEDATVASRYKKIVMNEKKAEKILVELSLSLCETPPERIVLDLDATDDPLHGNQEGRFFHGYYKEYCYLPLYIFCGNHLLVAKLRQSNGDASEGTVEELSRIVPMIRRKWPEIPVMIRADSGFCREEIMAWCENNRVDYLLGLAQNKRLNESLAGSLEKAKVLYEETREASRVFQEMEYRTMKSWSRARRVVGKAEHLQKGANPRFVVTSMSAERYDARTLYEDVYCARGEMENRIKEQQQFLFADRTSTSVMRSNQIRLWFSSVAYVLMNALRQFGLKGTEMEGSYCGTIRTKILKIGAQVKISVRRVHVALCSAFPYKRIFEAIFRNLAVDSPLRC